MASADNEATDGVQENEETEQTEAEKQRKMDSALIRIKSRKRTAKIKLTKLRHELEKLCVKDSEIPMIESAIEQLWKALENTLDVLEELSAFTSKWETRQARTKYSTKQKQSKTKYKQPLKKDKM